MADLKAKFPKETLSILERMSVAEFIDQLSKYPVVTRKLLLIRPLRPGNTSEVHINAIADDVKKVAEEGNWDVKDLKGNQATKDNILDAIKTKNPDFIMYFGHSYNTYIPGQENNMLVQAITPQNVHVLSGRAVIANACNTAMSLGLPAINAKTRAYIGYMATLTLLRFPPDAEKDCVEALTVANLALLKGETYEMAEKKGLAAWNQKWKYWSDYCIKNKNKLNEAGKLFCTMGPDALLYNRDHFKRWGEAKAVARPIGIVITA